MNDLKHGHRRSRHRRPARDRARDRALVRRWLYVVAWLIVAMVVVGGATRLTHAGLSITEWQPIHGVIPPLGEAEWQEEFSKYRQIPEYQILNQGMTLGEFQGIFWWEWAHRLLGRVIGAGLPSAARLLRGDAGGSSGRWSQSSPALFVLGGIQGAIGWWMVASGLATAPTSASTGSRSISRSPAPSSPTSFGSRAGSAGPAGRRAARSAVAGSAIVALVFLQIFLGGLVAGLDAGLTFNTWPLMDGTVVPSGLLIQTPGLAELLRECRHRAVRSPHGRLSRLRRGGRKLGAGARHAPRAPRCHARRLVVAQAALGIATLLLVVPLPLALLHQFGAVAVLSHAVLNRRAMSAPLAAAAVA